MWTYAEIFANGVNKETLQLAAAKALSKIHASIDRKCHFYQNYYIWGIPKPDLSISAMEQADKAFLKYIATQVFQLTEQQFEEVYEQSKGNSNFV